MCFGGRAAEEHHRLPRGRVFPAPRCFLGPPFATPPPADDNPVVGSHESSISAAARALRAFHTGTLFHDGVPEPVRLVLDNATGRPIIPLAPRVFEADEHVLHLPEEGESSLQLLVIPEEIDPGTSAGVDRWHVYHGEAREPRWSRFALDCARLGRAVLDGAELMQPNYLGPFEPDLLRRAGSDTGRLLAAAAAAAGKEIEGPVPVGVDPLGLDLRARFGIVRLEFVDPVMPGPSAAERAANQIDLILTSRGGLSK